MFENDLRAHDRLESELIVWLTTVRPDGQPQTSPVWFLVDGDEILVYSKHSARVANVRANPRVALNLDGNGRGGDVVTIEGTARIVHDEPPAFANFAYVAKYQARMARNDWTPEMFSEDYPVAIRVRFDRGRSW